MNYHLITYGCQANERDSETIAGLLNKMGYQEALQPDQADLIFFNTCCIRDKAENKALSKLGELKRLKEKKPDLIIGVTGCMVQQENMPEKIRHRAPHVDLILGIHNFHEIPQCIENIKRSKGTLIQVQSNREELLEGLPSSRQFPFKALVHITFGCNNFCTYCIVPYVRGREKSRLPENILAEINNLVHDGVIEVMLLGQNVNSYGKDLALRHTFAQLLTQVAKVEGLKRIRYMTSHPRDFTEELISTIKNTPKVCPHFHLPVQAGSDRILKLMNRGYSRENYLKLAQKIKETFPQASLTTDIIVGFPGETEEDFKQTLELIRQVRFDSAFTFIYSTRKGTPAAEMEGQVPTPLKKERLQRLMSLQNQISLEINQSYQGKIVDVLVEGNSKTEKKILTGRSEENKTVLFSGPEDLIGQIVPVKITAPQTWVLKGERI